MADIAKLKELIRREPNLVATFDELDDEVAALQSHFKALQAKHAELAAVLDEIESAKRQLDALRPTAVVVEPAADETETGEPEPSDSPADKPTDEGN